MASKWVKIVNAVKESVVLVETPTKRGTGFVIPPPHGITHQTVITAYHVIDHALDWKEPIRITHFPSGKQALLDVDSRAMNQNPNRDMALIHFSADDLPLPKSKIEMVPIKNRLNDGVQAAWLGYPAVAPYNLCFFTGHISTWLEPDEAYLVDGVAISGVSGGPAFFENEKGKIMILLRPRYTLH